MFCPTGYWHCRIKMTIVYILCDGRFSLLIDHPIILNWPSGFWNSQPRKTIISLSCMSMTSTVKEPQHEESWYWTRVPKYIYFLPIKGLMIPITILIETFWQYWGRQININIEWMPQMRQLTIKMAAKFQQIIVSIKSSTHLSFFLSFNSLRVEWCIYASVN